MGVLPTAEAVHGALKELPGAWLRGREILVEPVSTLKDDALNADMDCRDRISWKGNQDLFQVSIYDPSESVVTFCERIEKKAPVLQCPARAAEATCPFQAAAKREHAQEKQALEEPQHDSLMTARTI